MNIKTLMVGPIGTNCYLLCDEDAKACAVIDPGGDGARIAAAVAETGCAPCAILLTHGHYDHTGAVGELQAKWPEAPVYLNHRDVYDDAYTQQLFPALSGDVRDYDEGDTVAVGGLTVSVLATPGHSEGSVTLRCGSFLLRFRYGLIPSGKYLFRAGHLKNRVQWSFLVAGLITVCFCLPGKRLRFWGVGR